MFAGLVAPWPQAKCAPTVLDRRNRLGSSTAASIKEFLEAGKKRLAGDTAREASSGEVKDLRREAQALKEVVAEQALEIRLLKKKRARQWGRPRMRYAMELLPASERWYMWTLDLKRGSLDKWRAKL